MDHKETNLKTQLRSELKEIDTKISQQNLNSDKTIAQLEKRIQTLK